MAALNGSKSIIVVGTPLSKIVPVVCADRSLPDTVLPRPKHDPILGQRSAIVSDSYARRPAPNRLREYRQALGLDQVDVVDGLAALTDEEIALDANAVSRHERGRCRPTKRYRRLYCAFFQVSEAELWPRPLPVDQAGDPVLTAPWSHRGTVEASMAVVGSDESVQRRAFLFLSGAALTGPAHQWLVQEPGQLVAALHGDRVTSELADRLPPMVAELRRMDDVSGGGVVLGLAEREFGWVAGLLDRSSYDEATGRRLHVALAELGQIAGFAAYDLGDQVRAQRYYLTALRAAHTADDRAVGANILKFMAEQAADAGRPHDALTLLDSALAGVRGSATAAQVALLHSWKAYAWSVLQDESACQKAISVARAQAEAMTPANTPPWLYWLRPNDITAQAGDSLLRLGRTEQAELLLERSSNAFPHAHQHLGDQQLYLLRLATAQLRRTNLDGAVDTGNRVLDLAERRSSPWSVGRLQRFCRELAAQQDVAVVRGFLERVRVVVG